LPDTDKQQRTDTANIVRKKEKTNHMQKKSELTQIIVKYKLTTQTVRNQYKTKLSD